MFILVWISDPQVRVKRPLSRELVERSGGELFFSVRGSQQSRDEMHAGEKAYRQLLTVAEDCRVLDLLWELWQHSACRFLPGRLSLISYPVDFLVSTSLCGLSFLCPLVLEVGGSSSCTYGSLCSPFWLIFRKNCVKPM